MKLDPFVNIFLSLDITVHGSITKGVVPSKEYPRPTSVQEQRITVALII